MRLDAVGDHVRSLAGSWRGIHAETADASTVNCGVCAICRCEWQVLEDCRVKHSQAMQFAHWPALVITYGIHRSAHPFPP